MVNVTVDDPRLPPITEIGREENGKMTWYKDEEGVTKVFREMCTERYNLAKKAPVMKTKLASLNDINEADLSYAMSILNGTSPLPEDLDGPTKEYLKEIVEMAKAVSKEGGKRFRVTRRMFVDFWERANDHTQSSVSGHHYGFYKAASK